MDLQILKKDLIMNNELALVVQTTTTTTWSMKLAGGLITQKSALLCDSKLMENSGIEKGMDA